MNFQKTDLEGTQYNWSDAGHIFNGEPTRRGFDKSNGDQVLFLINYFGSQSDQFTLQAGKNIERSILYELPHDAKSEISVCNWIKNTIFSND